MKKSSSDKANETIDAGGQAPATAAKSVSARPAPYRTLDAWRGLASLAVVALHWSEVVLRRSPEFAADPLYAYSHWGGLGVQIFFVISGYCIANAAVAALRRGDGVGSYVRARLRRIFPTYWAALLLVIALSVLGTELARRGVIANNVFMTLDLTALPPEFVFANLTLTMLPLKQPIILIVAWTLCYELAFYGIVALALLVARRVAASYDAVLGERVLLSGMHTLTIGALLWHLASPAQKPFPLDMWPQFGLGAMVYDVLAARPGKRVAKVWLSVGLALCALFVVLWDVPMGFMAQSSRAMFAATGLFSLLLLLLYRHDEKLSRVGIIRALGAVGIFSYSLYLTHFMMVRFAGQILRMLHFPASLHYIAFVFAVGVAVAVGYAFFLLFERPFLRSRSSRSGGSVTREVGARSATPSPTSVAAAGEPAG